jgi:hypothetical protein
MAARCLALPPPCADLIKALGDHLPMKASGDDVDEARWTNNHPLRGGAPQGVDHLG